MMRILSNLLLKSGGLIAAIIFACNYLHDLPGILTDINKIGTAGDGISCALLATINYKIGFYLLCLLVIVVGYHIFNQLIKTICEEYTLFNYERREKAKTEFEQLRNTIIETIKKTTTKTPESRDFIPKDKSNENNP